MQVDGIHPQAPSLVELVCPDSILSIELFHRRAPSAATEFRREDRLDYSLEPFAWTELHAWRNAIRKLDAGILKSVADCEQTLW
jgi:hypothetical protein